MFPISSYMAIMKPLRQRMGKRTTLAIAGAVWLLGIILSLPNILTYTTYRHEMDNGDYRIICYTEWPDGQTNESMMENVYVYFIVLFIGITTYRIEKTMSTCVGKW